MSESESANGRKRKQESANVASECLRFCTPYTCRSSVCVASGSSGFGYRSAEGNGPLVSPLS